MITQRVRFSILILICAGLACAAPNPSAPVLDADAINTYIVQTAQSALTLSAVPLLMQTVTPSLTTTPTPTLSATPGYTFTPIVPIVIVSVNTNCRSGPGKVYDYKGALLVGDAAEIFARDPGGNYWYINNPDNPGHFCWVWGKYAIVSGNVSALPIYTPPPTPTPTSTPSPTLTPSPTNTPSPTFPPAPAPNFEASYTSMDSCAGWWVELKLRNSGAVDFKSVEVVLLDQDTGTTVSNLTDGFTDLNGCISSATKDTLAAGTSLIISAPAFAFDPTGHALRATITACSKNGLNGVCVTQTINFKP